MQGEKLPNEEDDTHLKIKKKPDEAAREDETSLFLCFELTGKSFT
jgi:hypothetical protein